MRPLIVLFLLILSQTFICAQELRRSSTYIDTYYHGEKHFSIREASEIYFHEGNSEMMIIVDFASLKTGVDSLDEWLLDLSDSKLTFKATLPTGDLLTLTHHNLRSLEVVGVTNFNGKSARQVASIHFYELSKEGMLFMNTGADYYDRIGVNIQLTVLPKQFGIDKKPHHLKKKISIAVGKGVINKQ